MSILSSLPSILWLVRPKCLSHPSWYVQFLLQCHHWHGCWNHSPLLKKIMSCSKMGIWLARRMRIFPTSVNLTLGPMYNTSNNNSLSTISTIQVWHIIHNYVRFSSGKSILEINNEILLKSITIIDRYTHKRCPKTLLLDHKATLEFTYPLGTHTFKETPWNK